MSFLTIVLALLTSAAAVAQKTYWKGEEIPWEDTPLTGALWTMIKNHDDSALKRLLADQSIVPPPALVRSADGRGPLFWAYEYGFTEAVEILETIGVSKYTKDAAGKTALQIGFSNKNKAVSEDHYSDEDEEEAEEDDEYSGDEF